MGDKKRRTDASHLEGGVDCIYAIDRDKHVRYTNETMVESFGKCVGKKCFEIFHERKSPCDWCRAEEVFAGKSVCWEHTTPHKDRIYEVIEFPLKNSDGSLWKVSVLRNITEKKREERKLRISEKDYKRLFEHVGVGVYISSKEGKFLDANSALLEMMGYRSKEEFLTVDITTDVYVRPEDRRKFQKMIERKRQVVDLEVDFKKKDGNIIPALLTAHAR